MHNELREETMVGNFWFSTLNPPHDYAHQLFLDCSCLHIEDNLLLELHTQEGDSFNIFLNLLFIKSAFRPFDNLRINRNEAEMENNFYRQLIIKILSMFIVKRN